MPAINIMDLNNAKTDVDHIAEIATSPALTATDRLANTKKTIAGVNADATARLNAIDSAALSQRTTIQASADLVIGGFGYAPPVAYAAGLSITTATQTVEFTSEVYAPRLSALPFVTGAVFDASKWRLIQGVTAADVDLVMTLRNKGGVADYAGTPLYDGADAARITATDNTAAFNTLVNAAIAAGHSAVKIPAGHWGIKTGNLAFSNFDKLRIFGDGIGVTILDFIKEDATRVTGIDETSSPNVIATFTTGNGIEFADMTITATTKAGVVNGTTGPANAAAVYFGAVWGFNINNVKDVRFTRVRAEHFNHRGFSIYGTATERVTIMHCEGFYNVASGFVISNAATVKVISGEFAYNGILGNPGTGYGITASVAVGKFLVKGVYAHHNYRKGVDSHGCGQFVVKGSTFENNVLFHIANPNWNVPIGIVDGAITIKGNTFSNGKLPADAAWMKTCYDALIANGFTNSAMTASVITIYDQNQAGATLNKIKSIVIEDNDVLCHYNGVSDTAMATCFNPIFIFAPTADVVLKNNRFNFDKTAFPADSDIYSHVLMAINSGAVKLAGNDIKFLTATQYTNSVSGLTDFGAMLSLVTQPIAMALELHDNRFDLNDCYFITSTASGQRNPVPWNMAGSRRIAINNTWRYLSDPFKTSSGLDVEYFLGKHAANNVPLFSKGNTFVRNGVRYSIPDGNQLNITTGVLPWRIEATTKAIGADCLAIVLDKTFHTTIRISTNDGTPELIVTTPFGSYSGIAGTTTNGIFSFSSADALFAEDGLTKLKIILKAKVALSGDYWGRVTIDGVYPSLGIERVIQL
jgi:hypothetical protein